jgi:hypothetical protein
MKTIALVKGLLAFSVASSAAVSASVTVAPAPATSSGLHSTVLQSFATDLHTGAQLMSLQDVQRLAKEFPQMKTTSSSSDAFQITIVQHAPHHDEIAYKGLVIVPSDIPRVTARSVNTDIPYEAECSYGFCTQGVVHVGFDSVITLGNDDVVALNFIDRRINPASKIELDSHHLDTVITDSWEISQKFVLKPGAMVALNSDDRTYFISRGGVADSNSW